MNFDYTQPPPDTGMNPRSLIGCKCGSMKMRHSDNDLHRYSCTVCSNKTAWYITDREARRAWNREFGR